MDGGFKAPMAASVAARLGKAVKGGRVRQSARQVDQAKQKENRQRSLARTWRRLTQRRGAVGRVPPGQQELEDEDA